MEVAPEVVAQTVVRAASEALSTQTKTSKRYAKMSSLWPIPQEPSLTTKVLVALRASLAKGTEAQEAVSCAFMSSTNSNLVARLLKQTASLVKKSTLKAQAVVRVVQFRL